MTREPYTINPGGLPEKPREPVKKSTVILILGGVGFIIGSAFGLAAAIMANFCPHPGLQEFAGAMATIFGLIALAGVIVGMVFFDEQPPP